MARFLLLLRKHGLRALVVTPGFCIALGMPTDHSPVLGTVTALLFPLFSSLFREDLVGIMQEHGTLPNVSPEQMVK